MKYRIKSRQTFFLGIFNRDWTDGSKNSINYKVQAKFPYIPFWITVTRSFASKADTEEYIELIQNEKENQKKEQQ